MLIIIKIIIMTICMVLHETFEEIKEIGSCLEGIYNPIEQIK